ncbi:MAG: hypothetical protein ACR2PH_18265, partial [Desulfobulbia bacterium]
PIVSFTEKRHHFTAIILFILHNLFTTFVVSYLFSILFMHGHRVGFVVGVPILYLIIGAINIAVPAATYFLVRKETAKLYFS